MSRPAGQLNGQGITHHRNTTIRKWRPKYEMIVQLSITGMSNKALAEKFNLHEVRISQILNSPQAKLIQARTVALVKEIMLESVQDDLASLAVESVRRIGQTLRYEDFVLGTDAKKHQDNLALGVLKGTGFLNGESNEDDKKKPAPLTESLMARLTAALEKSNEAAEIQNQAKSEPIEANYEVVEK